MSEYLQRQSSSQRKVKLAAHDVKVHYINYQRRQHTYALAGISLDIYDQEFVSIVGLNVVCCHCFRNHHTGGLRAGPEF